MHDPDVALNRTTDDVLHWLIFNIPGTATGLPENVPIAAQLPDGSVQGKNRGNLNGYRGPGAPAAIQSLRLSRPAYENEKGSIRQMDAPYTYEEIDRVTGATRWLTMCSLTRCAAAAASRSAFAFVAAMTEK